MSGTPRRLRSAIGVGNATTSGMKPQMTNSCRSIGISTTDKTCNNDPKRSIMNSRLIVVLTSMMVAVATTLFVIRWRKQKI